MTRNRRKKVGKVESPCILVCKIKNGYCEGCKRTPEEIRDWIIMSEYEQQKLKYELMWRKENRGKVLR